MVSVPASLEMKVRKKFMFWFEQRMTSEIIFFYFKKTHQTTQNRGGANCATPPRNTSAFGTKLGRSGVPSFLVFAAGLFLCASWAAAASRRHVSGGGGPAQCVLIRAPRHHRGGTLSRPGWVTHQGTRSIFSRLPGGFAQVSWCDLCKVALPQPIMSSYANLSQSPAIRQGKVGCAGPRAGEGVRWVRGPPQAPLWHPQAEKFIISRGL